MKGIVTSVHRTGCEVFIESNDDTCKTIGTVSTNKLIFCLLKHCELPVVGDKVSLEKREDKYFIVEILPRKNLIARYDFYKDRHQGFAANVDVVFIVTSANREFSKSRIERFLALCEGQDVRRVVVVTKKDLAEEIPKVNIDGIEQININALNRKDVEKIKWKGTALLMGSSGVGKSTILNTLCGLNIKTSDVQGERLANKGRHTTSARTMYFLVDGRRVIDTPGVRIVGVEGIIGENRRQRERKN